MNNLVEACYVGLGRGVNYTRWLVLLYHLYFFCNTVSALSETIPPIWFNLNIDYLAVW